MDSSLNKEAYLEDVERDLERLLSNMDRNRGSESYGCLARPFWHDKVTDFPSAHQQIGVFPLALAYTQDWEGNPFYRDDQVREYVDAGLRFWSRIQKKDGSFDEHYPNEHSLGAVSWTLWAVTEAYLLLDEPPEIEDSIEKAVEFLERKDEPGDIANHQAVTASALVNADRIIGRGAELAEERMQGLKEMQHEEGWFQEYIGVDIGYQSTSISHMARVWNYDRELVEEEVIEKALDFFSCFIDDKNYYSGIIGSRNTEHIHAAGFEILAEEFDKAERVAGAIRKNRAEDRLLSPGQMDDKHFSRQLAEYVDAYRRAEKEPETVNNVEGREFETITIRVYEGRKIYANTSKGGVYRLYEDGEFVESDTGIAVKKDGKIFTGNWPGVTEEVERDGESLVIEGKLRQVPRGTLPDYYFLASRAFNYTLGRSSWLSLTVKNFLISMLIGSDNEGMEFRREIRLGEDLDVNDTFDTGEEIDGKVRSNFVPSSEFFSIESLVKRR